MGMYVFETYMLLVGGCKYLRKNWNVTGEISSPAGEPALLAIQASMLGRWLVGSDPES